MIYPKGIIDYLKTNDVLKDRFHNVLSTNRLLNIAEEPVDENVHSDFVEYMFSEGYIENAAIKKYLFFLSTMHGIFHRILKYFDKINPNSTHKDDIYPAGTHPDELLHHALYIYYLHSHGIRGDVMECGTFKGFSTCCLSWVCNYLGMRLITADSFKGLPANETDDYYKKGDFKGTLEEVKHNLGLLGKIDCVDFVKGFYRDSLSNYEGRISTLWIDVDLYESTMDILTNLMPHIRPGGVLISHELFAGRDFSDGRLLPTIGPSKALSEFFQTNGIEYQASPFINGSGLVVFNSISDGHLLWSEKTFNKILFHLSSQTFQDKDALISRLENENRSLQQQLKMTVDGFSFRLGRVITSPLRFLSGRR